MKDNVLYFYIFKYCKTFLKRNMQGTFLRCLMISSSILKSSEDKNSALFYFGGSHLFFHSNSGGGRGLCSHSLYSLA